MFKHDGRTRPLTEQDLQPGVVIRHVEVIEESEKDSDGWWSPGGPLRLLTSPFSDCVILGVIDGMVRLARPYCYATSTETICPSPLMGCERFDVEVHSLLSARVPYHVVLMSTGEPAKYIT